MSAKRNKMIETAQRLFNDNGIVQTSMDDIASAVPVAKMTLYKYVGSKEQLLELVLQQVFDDTIRLVQEVIDSAADPLEALIGLARIKEKSPVSDLFAKDLVTVYPQLMQTLFAEQQAQINGMFERLIFEGQQQGFFRKELSPHIVLQFIIALKQVVAQSELIQDETQYDLLTKQMVSILYGGIVSEKHRARLT